MFKKICSFILLSFVTFSSFLAGEVEYEIQDIGTLQTHSSKAIAINNQGQILGWYNIDGTAEAKHFFVSDRARNFNEILSGESGISIDWRYLLDSGVAYGLYYPDAYSAILYMWNQHDGVVNLGNFPVRSIIAVNDLGQFLISSSDLEDGKVMIRPAIWQNGQITRLKGLGGDLGIEAEESYGHDINNNGDVVGRSRILLSYKNKLYSQFHATKWSNGQSIDLHDQIPKSTYSMATAINDHGDVLISPGLLFLEDGKVIDVNGGYKTTNRNYLYRNSVVIDRNGKKIIDIDTLREIHRLDKKSIWWGFEHILGLNDSGEIITNGITVWGEEHAMLLTPVKAE
jgi:uncharacterized membrane protein